jgi:hypothetical protein
VLPYDSFDDQDIGTFKMANSPTLLRRAAVDESRRLIFIIEANNDTSVHAIPLNAVDNTGVLLPDAVVTAPLLHSGQQVHYDPISETVFAPFNQGDGHTFTPFRVGGTPTAPTLKPRVDDWDPPPDLRPVLLGIRQLETPNCP